MSIIISHKHNAAAGKCKRCLNFSFSESLSENKHLKILIFVFQKKIPDQPAPENRLGSRGLSGYALKKKQNSDKFKNYPAEF